MNRFLVGLALALITIHHASGQTPEPTFNYNESKVGTYTLPNPLINANGKPVKTQADWRSRRAELIQLFAENVYGQTPKQAVKLRFQTTHTDNNALNGLAIRKQVSIFFTDYPKLPPIEVLVYIPKTAKQPVAAFLGLNFCGNHCVTTEADIPLSTRWMISNAVGEASVNNKATEKFRGMQARR